MSSNVFFSFSYQQHGIQRELFQYLFYQMVSFIDPTHILEEGLAGYWKILLSLSFSKVNFNQSDQQIKSIKSWAQWNSKLLKKPVVGNAKHFFP